MDGLFFVVLQFFGFFYLDRRARTDWRLKIYCALINTLRLFNNYQLSQFYAQVDYGDPHESGRTPLKIEYIVFALYQTIATLYIILYNHRLVNLSILFSDLQRKVPWDSQDIYWIKAHLTVLFTITAAHMVFKLISLPNIITYQFLLIFQYSSLCLVEAVFALFILSVRACLKAQLRRFTCTTKLTVKEVKELRLFYDSLCRLSFRGNAVLKMGPTILILTALVMTWTKIYLCIHYMLHKHPHQTLDFTKFSMDYGVQFFKIVKVLLYSLSVNKLMGELVERISGVLRRFQIGELRGQVEAFSVQIMLGRVKLYGYGFPLNLGIIALLFSTMTSYILILFQIQLCSHSY